MGSDHFLPRKLRFPGVEQSLVIFLRGGRGIGAVAVGKYSKNITPLNISTHNPATKVLSDCIWRMYWRKKYGDCLGDRESF